jgi:hypothetical protein
MQEMVGVDYNRTPVIFRTPDIFVFVGVRHQVFNEDFAFDF